MKNETRGRDRGRYLAVTYPIGHYLDAKINRQQTASTHINSQQHTAQTTDNIQYLVNDGGGLQLATRKRQELATSNHQRSTTSIRTIRPIDHSLAPPVSIYSQQ
jgi:hypothetical protein